MSTESEAMGVEEHHDFCFFGSEMEEYEKKGGLSRLLSYLDGTSYRYVLLVTVMMGEVFTGIARDYRPGTPHTDIFVSEEFLPLLREEKQHIHAKKCQWFEYKDMRLVPIKKRTLVDEWLKNEDNYNKALSWMLYRFVEEYPDLLLTKE